MSGSFGAQFHDLLQGTWDEAKGYIREEFEQLRSALNNQTSNGAFDEQEGTIDPDVLALGDSKQDTRYVANTGPHHRPKWDKVNLSNGVKGILQLVFLPSQAASTLLGRRSASSGTPEAITLGSGLTMTGTVLNTSTTVSTGFAKHFLLMGS